MRALSSLVLALLLLAPGTSALADGEEPATPAPLQRGFADGRFVDGYFGVSYAADGLEKGFSLGGPASLFAGRLADGLEVEILVAEGKDAKDAAAWRDQLQEQMAHDGRTRTDVVRGDEPMPCLLFVEESLAGFKRHHAWGFVSRGSQAIVVHAQVREQDDTSAARLVAALGHVVVEPEVEAFLFAHLAARNAGGDPRAPISLAQAAEAYLSQTEDYPRAMRTATLAIQGATGAAAFAPDERYQVQAVLGLAQLMGGAREAALATWREAIELAKATTDPAANAMNAWYNLACGLSLLGRTDEAFEALAKAFETGPADAAGSLRAHAKQDGDLESLHGDARWAEVVGG